MRHSLRIIAALALLFTMTLTGCTGLVEKVIKDQTGIDINTDDGTVKVDTDDGTVQIGGADFPSDFPAGIPVPKGTLAATLVADGTWALTYSDVDRAELDRLMGELEAAGFQKQGMVNAEGAVQGGFQNDQWGITILWEEKSASLVYGVAAA